MKKRLKLFISCSSCIIIHVPRTILPTTYLFWFIVIREPIPSFFCSPSSSFFAICHPENTFFIPPLLCTSCSQSFRLQLIFFCLLCTTHIIEQYLNINLRLTATWYCSLGRGMPIQRRKKNIKDRRKKERVGDVTR